MDVLTVSLIVIDANDATFFPVLLGAENGGKFAIESNH